MYVEYAGDSAFRNFLSRKPLISASLPVSFLTFDLLPLGCPDTAASARLRARASLVCCEIRLRSISQKDRK